METAQADAIVQIRMSDGRVVDIVNWTDLPIYSTADFNSGFTLEEMDLFQYVAGREVPGAGNGSSAVVKRTATELDTNMATAGQMTTNEEMLVYAIKPEVYMFTVDPENDFTSRSIVRDGVDGSLANGMPGPSPECLWVLDQQVLLRLQVSQSIKAEAGFGYFNTGFGPFQSFGYSTPAASTYGGTATAGIPQQTAVRAFVLGTHIGAQEKFRVQIVNPQGLAVNFGITEAISSTNRVNRDDVMMTLRVNLEGLYKRPTA